MTEQIRIDEKYTYQFDNGHVQILRNGEPWLGEQPGGFPGSKAWISAANEIERLRERVAELERQQAPEPKSEPSTEKRFHSRDPKHLSEDLEAALRAGLEPSELERADLPRRLVNIQNHSDVQMILRSVLTDLGPRALGGIALFSIEAETSIMGDVEALTSRWVLAQHDLGVDALEWPADVLHPVYEGMAAQDTPAQKARIARIRAAVADYRKEH